MQYMRARITRSADGLYALTHARMQIVVKGLSYVHTRREYMHNRYIGVCVCVVSAARVVWRTTILCFFSVRRCRIFSFVVVAVEVSAHMRCASAVLCVYVYKYTYCSGTLRATQLQSQIRRSIGARSRDRGVLTRARFVCFKRVCKLCNVRSSWRAHHAVM